MCNVSFISTYITCVYAYICILYLCIYIYVCMYVWMYVCMYAYTYIYIYIHIIFMCIYIYVCACIHAITLKIGGTVTPTNFEVKILGPRWKHRAIPYWQSVVLWAQSFDSHPFPSLPFIQNSQTSVWRVPPITCESRSFQMKSSSYMYVCIFIYTYYV